jgi:hypothetical protein
MSLMRAFIIICFSVFVTSSMCFVLGGNLWLWVCGGWLLSGPLVVFYAHSEKLQTQRQPQEDRAALVSPPSIEP